MQAVRAIDRLICDLAIIARECEADYLKLSKEELYLTDKWPHHQVPHLCCQTIHSNPHSRAGSTAASLHWDQGGHCDYYCYLYLV